MVLEGEWRSGTDGWELSVIILARSPEYPQRIRVASVFEMFFDCLIVLCLSACQQIFSISFIFHFISFIRVFAVLAFHSFHRTHKTSLRVKKTIPESMPCIVAHSTRRYIETAVGPLHPALHRNGA